MYKKMAVSSTVFLICGIVIGFIGFPLFMNYTIRKQVTLKPGTQSRQMWEKLPFPLNFSVFVFNVTNAEEVQNGGKPSVQEIGPFVFEEWKDKYNIEDNEENDTVSYNMRNTFIFRPDLGLTGEEIVTMPHPLIQIISLAVKRDRAPMINMTSQGLVEIFHPTTPFITASFLDIFYRGIDVDCSSESYAAKAVCLSFYSGSIKGTIQVNETFFKFSILGASNHSDAGLFKVSRGLKKLGTVGKVLEFDGKDELSNWYGEECNKLRGTDSTIFPPLMQRDDALVAFSADMCRSFNPKFQCNSDYNGVPSLRYTLNFGDMKNEPKNQCYCKSYPNSCPPKGTIDLSSCNESPMYASHPHFLHGDPKLIRDIRGICPSEELHGFYINYEIISGTLLSVARRIQWNLDVQPIPELDVMRNMRRLIMPLFWIEQSLELGTEYTNLIRIKIFLLKKINNAFKWTSVIVGGIGCCISMYLYYANKRNLITEKLSITAKD